MLAHQGFKCPPFSAPRERQRHVVVGIDVHQCNGAQVWPQVLTLNGLEPAVQSFLVVFDDVQVQRGGGGGGGGSCASDHVVVDVKKWGYCNEIGEAQKNGQEHPQRRPSREHRHK